MKRTYCDTPDCGRDMTTESRYIVGASVLNPNESEPKLRPAIQEREICAICFGVYKDALACLAEGRAKV